MTFSFDHVHIFSRDPQTLGIWFATFFDAKVQHLEAMSKIFVGDLTLLVRHVSQSEVEPMPSYGLNHIGLAVEQIDAVYEDFKTKGAIFHLDINTPRPGLRMFFVSGPDNVLVEVLERDDRFVP